MKSTDATLRKLGPDTLATLAQTRNYFYLTHYIQVGQETDKQLLFLCATGITVTLALVGAFKPATGGLHTLGLVFLVLAILSFIGAIVLLINSLFLGKDYITALSLVDETVPPALSATRQKSEGVVLGEKKIKNLDKALGIYEVWSRNLIVTGVTAAAFLIVYLISI